MKRKKEDHISPALRQALLLMPIVAREKARRYKQQKKFAEKLFGKVVEQILGKNK